jgi:acetylglutamate kinase
LRKDIDDASSLIQRISVTDLSALIADGTISGGMIPKIESCMQAVKGGVKSAHILDGRIAHVLLLELFTDQGVGTMITGVN